MALEVQDVKRRVEFNDETYDVPDHMTIKEFIKFMAMEHPEIVNADITGPETSVDKGVNIATYKTSTKLGSLG